MTIYVILSLFCFVFFDALSKFDNKFDLMFDVFSLFILHTIFDFFSTTH